MLQLTEQQKRQCQTTGVVSSYSCKSEIGIGLVEEGLAQSCKSLLEGIWRLV